MPALPPPPVPLSATLAPTLGQQVLPPALRAAYRQTLEAWGGHAAVTVHTTGKPLPAGLQALMARHNPALERALVGASGRPSSGKPVSAALAQALQAADGQVLDRLVQEGWLTQRPQERVDRPWGDQDSYTENQWDRLGVATVHMAASPSAFHVDPVLFRWVTLCHEAAHTDLARQAGPLFHLNAWTPAQNTAMSRLLFWREDTHARGVFEESYADAYGALLALRLTDKAAWPAVETLLAQREANTAARQAAIHRAGDTPAVTLANFDPHVTEAGLRQVMQAVKAGEVNVATLTPAQMRSLAREAASASLVAFLRGPEGRVADEWAWAQATPATDEARRQVEGERLQQYLGDRQEAYFLAANRRQVMAPEPGEDPVLQAVARQDADFANQYWALPATLRAQIRAAYVSGGQRGRQ